MFSTILVVSYFLNKNHLYKLGPAFNDYVHILARRRYDMDLLGSREVARIAIQMSLQK